MYNRIIEIFKEPNGGWAMAVVIIVTVLALYGFYKLCDLLFNIGKHYKQHHDERKGR